MDQTAHPPVALIRQLGALGHETRAAHWLRLGGGRTNRAWLHVDLGVVVKLYAANTDNPLFGNDPVQEYQALVALDGADLAASPIARGRGAAGEWILYGHLPGPTWTSEVAGLADALMRLHRRAAWSGLPVGPDGSTDLAAQVRHILDRCKTPASRRIAGMCPPGDVAPSGLRRPLHRDPVPGNIVAGNTGIRFIDWQCPAAGDPCEDIAVFLSPAMQHLYRGATLGADEIRAFLAAYDDSALRARYLALKPWFHWRMAAYCLWQSECGKADYGAALALELAELEIALAA